MLVRTLSSSSQSEIYILAGLWALADAIWQTQINSLYGSLFIKEEKAAFSNYKLWESLGFLTAFITSATGVCVFPKIILLLVFLLSGMGGYLILEYLQSFAHNSKLHE